MAVCATAHDLLLFIIQVEYKKDLENTKGHSINYCETPQFKNVSKIAQYTSDVSMPSEMWLLKEWVHFLYLSEVLLCTTHSMEIESFCHTDRG